MCCRLDNSHHCLTFLTVIGFLQISVAIPIIVLSFLIFFQSSLGIILSPFWCGFSLLSAGIIAVLIRPTRLAIIICIHVMLNATSIIACLLAAGVSGVYGTAVHLPEFSDLVAPGSGSENSNQQTDCIFSESSTLFTNNVRTALHPIENFIPSCNNLNTFWAYLVSVMSLSFIGLLLSTVGIFTNCITPCVEDHQRDWKPKPLEI